MRTKIRDQEAIDLFESLACENHFAPTADRHDPTSHPWNRVMEEASRLRLQKMLAAEMRKALDNGSDEEGD